MGTKYWCTQFENVLWGFWDLKGAYRLIFKPCGQWKCWIESHHPSSRSRSSKDFIVVYNCSVFLVCHKPPDLFILPGSSSFPGPASVSGDENPHTSPHFKLTDGPSLSPQSILSHCVPAANNGQGFLSLRSLPALAVNLVVHSRKESIIATDTGGFIPSSILLELIVGSLTNVRILISWSLLENYSLVEFHHIKGSKSMR